jgi:hypothetical protein
MNLQIHKVKQVIIEANREIERDWEPNSSFHNREIVVETENGQKFVLSLFSDSEFKINV